MKRHTINSTYRQFYVADAGIEPMAPETWTEEDIQRRFNAHENIVALCPTGDITARILVIPPGEVAEEFGSPDFLVETQVTLPSGRAGIYGYPWELLEEHSVQPGQYVVRFSGYNIGAIEDEEDFYLVQLQAT
jgi:hypothetical protein